MQPEIYQRPNASKMFVYVLCSLKHRMLHKTDLLLLSNNQIVLLLKPLPQFFYLPRVKGVIFIQVFSH